MSEGWAYALAGELKKRNNPNILNPCIGVVISTSPFLVSIQDGMYLLDEKNAYICRHILERKSKMSFSVQNSQSGNINISCEGRGAYSSTGTISVNNQDIELYEVWKSGDKVLVIPDGRNEKFFIVDVLEGA